MLKAMWIAQYLELVYFSKATRQAAYNLLQAVRIAF